MAFGDVGLLERALSHRSWCAEHPGTLSNERLEFLGDAVLGMVVTDQLMRRHPDRSEGWLSQARSDLVRAGTLYQVAVALGLGDHVRLGRGEELTGGRDKPSILADAVEALIGAVYLDSGFGAAQTMVLGWLEDRLAAQDLAEGSGSTPAAADFKSRLQEWCARGGGTVPTYAWTESGPEHDKMFTVSVVIDGEVCATGTGRSKKQAEQAAAQHALDQLGASDGDDEPDSRRWSTPGRASHDNAATNEVTRG